MLPATCTDPTYTQANYIFKKRKKKSSAQGSSWLLFCCCRFFNYSRIYGVLLHLYSFELKREKCCFFFFLFFPLHRNYQLVLWRNVTLLRLCILGESFKSIEKERNGRRSFSSCLPQQDPVVRVDSKDRGDICGGLYTFHTTHMVRLTGGEGSKTNKEYLHVHRQTYMKISSKRREVFFLYGHLLLKALSFFSPPGTRKRRRKK